MTGFLISAFAAKRYGSIEGYMIILCFVCPDVSRSSSNAFDVVLINDKHFCVPDFVQFDLLYYFYLHLMAIANIVIVARGATATIQVDGMDTSYLHISRHSPSEAAVRFHLFANLDADCTEVENEETPERLYFTNSQASP